MESRLCVYERRLACLAGWVSFLFLFFVFFSLSLSFLLFFRAVETERWGDFIVNTELIVAYTNLWGERGARNQVTIQYTRILLIENCLNTSALSQALMKERCF